MREAADQMDALVDFRSIEAGEYSSSSRTLAFDRECARASSSRLRDSLEVTGYQRADQATSPCRPGHDFRRLFARRRQRMIQQRADGDILVHGKADLGALRSEMFGRCRRARRRLRRPR